MIRMGRSNKTELSLDTGNLPTAYETNSQSEPEKVVSMNRNTGSDSISREMRDGSLSGYVGQGTILNGEMSFQSLLRVDGQLTGRVMSESGTLIVGATGKLEANIAVASAVINGTVRGDIVATEKLELGRTAQIIGNIQAPRLVMEDGAILEGNCMMLKAREAFEKSSSENQSPAPPLSDNLKIEGKKAEMKVS